MKVNKWFCIRMTLVLAGGYSGLSITSPDVVASSNVDWEACLIIVLFAPLALLLVVGIQAINPCSAKVCRKPSWTINPFLFKEPLQFFHLGAYHFMAGGIVGSLSLFYRGTEAAPLAMLMLSIGAGVWLGVQLCILIFRKKMGNSTQ